MGEDEGEKIFEDNELEEVFSIFDSEEETEPGEILYNCREMFFKPPRKILLGSNIAEVSIPEKKRFRETVYHKLLICYDKIKAYEVLPVSVKTDRSSYPLNIGERGAYNLGEVFLFGFTTDETEWYAIDVFIPLDDVKKVGEILFKKTGRPQLSGVTHYGNLAAVKYIMNVCEKIYEYQVNLLDWIKGSSFMRPVRDKYERYIPRKEESAPPKIHIFKEGIAQFFSEDNPSILHQMSTFWPWNLIRSVTERGDKLVFEWYDKTYSFEQLISNSTDREELKRVCLECLSASKDRETPHAFFIRSNSFPSRYEVSWYNLEPFACEASRSGLPPKKC
ncbi:MAG: hypothetical protein QW327_05395 [Candidatus Odinarchaeota archaeon]